MRPMMVVIVIGMMPVMIPILIMIKTILSTKLGTIIMIPKAMMIILIKLLV